MENKYMQQLKDYWFLIVFLGALVMGWANFDSRISSIEATQERQSPIYIQIQKDIVEIKTTLEFIKTNIK